MDHESKPNNLLKKIGNIHDDKGEPCEKYGEENEHEILEGVLACKKCGVDYPIHEGIPDLLPKNLNQ